jgi:S-adenosylmethionine hydrolase
MKLLTLNTDIGSADFLVGAIKGQLLQLIPGVQLVDISHHLPSFNYPHTAYIGKNTLRHFPSGTFHLFLVNMFDSPSNQMLLAEHNGHFIGCADNGLLTMILEDTPQKVIALRTDESHQQNILNYTRIFGSAMQRLIEGETLEELGELTTEYNVRNPIRPGFGDNWIEGQIIYIDHFENVIVNITKPDFEAHRKGRQFSIVFKRDETIDRISQHYADVSEGQKLAFFNAAGYLEIAVNKGNAGGLFGLQSISDNPFHTDRVFYQTVKIFFE